MIKFIIVDDDSNSYTRTKEIVNRSVFGYNFNYKIMIFKGLTKELKTEIDDLNSIKIYILDIELDSSVNGFQIGKLIREKDIESHIIFLTSHEGMFEKVHRNLYNVFDFIEKFDDSSNRLERDINKIIKCNFDNKYLNYSYKNVDLKVLLKTINYIYRDSAERKIIVVTDNNKFEISTNLKNILDKLDGRFIQVHRSCIINNDNVAEINWSQGYFILNNGEKVYQVSKNYHINGEINANN